MLKIPASAPACRNGSSGRGMTKAKDFCYNLPTLMQDGIVI
ncbi:MAG: hypothetical protein ABI543_08545 [Ignavibacteria bacterium]